MDTRILLVSPNAPFSITSGSEQRTALLHEALASVADVDVLLAEPGSSASAQPAEHDRVAARITWQERGWRSRGYVPDPELPGLLSAHVDFRAYDLIVGRYLTPVSKLALPATVPTIVDLDDVRYRIDPRFRFNPVTFALRAKSAVKSRVMPAALARFSSFFFITERDRAEFPRLDGVVLPNIPFRIPDTPSREATGTRVLFVGALWYGPNRTGIERFLERSWPRVRSVVPEATLLLAGGAPPALRARWSSVPGVSAPGFVEDLDAVYRDCALTVSPIWFGGGSNIKVLESFAYGRAVVTTGFCYEAFRDVFAEADDLAVARDDVQLADRVIELLRDPAQTARRAKRGAAIVCSRFTRERFVEIVSRHVREVMERHGVRRRA